MTEIKTLSFLFIMRKLQMLFSNAEKRNVENLKIEIENKVVNQRH